MSPEYRKEPQFITDSNGRPIQDLSSQNEYFDFKSVNSFAANYLSTYYQGKIANDEIPVIKFLVDNFPNIERPFRLLEIGCGPTIHHALPAAPYAREIHMADYLQENLDEVRKWRDSPINSHDWSAYTYLTLSFEQEKKSSISDRENLLRSKITKLLFCNLLEDEVIRPSEQYEVVSAFYCTEEVGISKKEWKNVMRRVSHLVKSNGYLLLSALRNTSYYSVISQEGIRQQFPCANINENDFYEVLSDIGFDLHRTKIESNIIEGEEEEGVTGVVLVSARKK